MNKSVAIVMLLVFSLHKCFAEAGDEFLGDWQSKKDASNAGLLTVSKSGKYFVVDTAFMGNRIKMNATFDDGALKISSPTGTLLATYNKANGTLVFFDEYSRLKAVKQAANPFKQQQIEALLRASRVGPAATRTMPDLELAAECFENMKQVALACLIFAGDHNGEFPKKLEDLIPEQVQSTSIFRCPLATDGGDTTFLYFGGHKANSGEQSYTPLLRSRGLTRDGFAVVVYTDGAGALIRPVK